MWEAFSTDEIYKSYSGQSDSKKWPGGKYAPAHRLYYMLSLHAGYSSEESTQNGAPETIRTSDLPLRRRLLYPAELPGHGWNSTRIQYLP